MAGDRAEDEAPRGARGVGKERTKEGVRHGPRATPALPGGRADGGAGALRMSDAGGRTTFLSHPGRRAAVALLVGLGSAWGTGRGVLPGDGVGDRLLEGPPGAKADRRVAAVAAKGAQGQRRLTNAGAPSSPNRKTQPIVTPPRTNVRGGGRFWSRLSRCKAGYLHRAGRTARRMALVIPNDVALLLGKVPARFEGGVQPGGCRSSFREVFRSCPGVLS